MKHDLLIVIDFQNVYLPGNPWACPNTMQAAANTCALIDSGKIDSVIFTRFIAPEQPTGTWQDYNTEYATINADPYLCDMIEPVKPYLAQYPLYDKSVYTSMQIPQIRKAAAQADRVLIAGVVAECCVLATLMESIDCGFKTVYLTDCIAGQSDTHEASVRLIAESLAPMHTEVLTSQEYLAQTE